MKSIFWLVFYKLRPARLLWFMSHKISICLNAVRLVSTGYVIFLFIDWFYLSLSTLCFAYSWILAALSNVYNALEFHYISSASIKCCLKIFILFNLDSCIRKAVGFFICSTRVPLYLIFKKDENMRTYVISFFICLGLELYLLVFNCICILRIYIFLEVHFKEKGWGEDIFDLESYIFLLTSCEK